MRKNGIHQFIAVAFVFALLVTGYANAQPAHVRNAADVEIALQKLTVLGSVLYLGAHPDDENTAVLAYFSEGKKYRTAYLSFTRGDGGQNLIGSEKDWLAMDKRFFEDFKKQAIDSVKNKILGKELTGRQEPMVLNVAYLIPEEKIKDFKKEAQRLNQEIQANGFSLEYSGPWPAYNFTLLEIEKK